MNSVSSIYQGSLRNKVVYLSFESGHESSVKNHRIEGNNYYCM